MAMAVASSDIFSQSSADSLVENRNLSQSLTSFKNVSDIEDKGQAEEMEILRARAHAITLSQIAQAIHVVYSFNKARKIFAFSKQTVKKRAKITGEKLNENPMKVGIIGCGRLGIQLAKTLLTYGRVEARDLLISTRRPDALDELHQNGVVSFYDNKRIVSSVDLAFICVLPRQIEDLVVDIQSHIPDTCILYSFVSSYRPKRLKTLFKHKNFLVANYSWQDDNMGKPWDYSLGISTALTHSDMVEKTCPLSLFKKDALVYTSVRFVDQTLYAFSNMCTSCGFGRETILKLLNMVFFGMSEREETILSAHNKFIDSDVTTVLKKCPPGKFPLFDLTVVPAIDTPLMEKLKSNEKLRKSYRQQYILVFTSYSKNYKIV